MVPLLMYFMGPRLHEFLPAGAADDSWTSLAGAVWKYVVRPVAVGAMLVGSGFTLFKMRTSLAAGLRRAITDLKPAMVPVTSNRTEKYMSSKTVFLLIGVVFALMIGLYIYFSQQVLAGVVAAVVMLILGFFFATVSGRLCGGIRQLVWIYRFI